MPMKWATAVKMWNMHGKIYNPRHVYAIPRKGTAEYLDVKHIQEHDELPTHLKKKGPFPPEAMEQLRKHAEESTARREAAERKRLTEEIEKVRSPKLRIVEAEEEAPPIKVPALPERLEKKEKKTTTPAKAKVIAAILEEAKRRKLDAFTKRKAEEATAPVEGEFDRPAGPRHRKAPTKLSGADIESLLQEEKVETFRDVGKYTGPQSRHGSVHRLIRDLHQQKQDKKDEESRLQGIINSMKRFGEDVEYWKKATPTDKADYFEMLMNAPAKIRSLALKSANNASIQKAFELYERLRGTTGEDREKAKQALKGFRYTDEKIVKEIKRGEEEYNPAEDQEDLIKRIDSIKKEIKRLNSLSIRASAHSQSRAKGVSRASRNAAAAEEKRLDAEIQKLEKTVKDLERMRKRY
jgi:hypothetical protein